MVENDGRDIIIVSDLHLSTGYNRRTGTYSRREDFFYDAAFARFLDYLRGRDASGDRLRLVILGDLFDFLQVDPACPHKTPQELDRSDTMTRARMDTILQGHPLFFQALGRFVATGNPLDVVPGNHDIEMIRASTQEYFKQLLAQAAGDPKAAEGVTVYPWIYYVPGMLYAEHGQQYDEINSFATVLQPYEPREPLDPNAIDQPLGSYFVEYLFNLVEHVDPFADNIKPPTRYLAWALRTHPIVAPSTLGAHIGLFVKVLGHSSRLTREQKTEREERYHDTVVRPYSATLGLRPETVVAIDDLAAESAMTSKLGQLEALLAQPLAHFLPALGAVVALYGVLRRAQRPARSLALLAASIGGLIWRERRALQPTHKPSGYLMKAALGIHTLLQADGKEVPVYVFGHTHTPEQFPLTDDACPPHYINSGTWTPVVPSTFDLLATRECLTFVQVTRHPEPGAPTGALMQWNDNAGRAELLPLQSPLNE